MELSLFTFFTIANATTSFLEDNKIREGGFGPVYKGTKGAIRGAPLLQLEVSTCMFRVSCMVAADDSIEASIVVCLRRPLKVIDLHSDKDLMLDEVIEYLKSLQMQIQISIGIEKQTAKLQGSDEGVAARHESCHVVIGTDVSTLLEGQPRVEVRHI
ncbi:hypothetical protein Tco_0642124 [Tanacetum coccineum]